jgi:hypothetical protein
MRGGNEHVIAEAAERLEESETHPARERARVAPDVGEHRGAIAPRQQDLDAHASEAVVSFGERLHHARFQPGSRPAASWRYFRAPSRTVSFA